MLRFFKSRKECKRVPVSGGSDDGDDPAERVNRKLGGQNLSVARQNLMASIVRAAVLVFLIMLAMRYFGTDMAQNRLRFARVLLTTVAKDYAFDIWDNIFRPEGVLNALGRAMDNYDYFFEDDRWPGMISVNRLYRFRRVFYSADRDLYSALVFGENIVYHNVVRFVNVFFTCIDDMLDGRSVQSRCNAISRYIIDGTSIRPAPSNRRSFQDGGADSVAEGSSAESRGARSHADDDDEGDDDAEDDDAGDDDAGDDDAEDENDDDAGDDDAEDENDDDAGDDDADDENDDDAGDNDADDDDAGDDDDDDGEADDESDDNDHGRPASPPRSIKRRRLSDSADDGDLHDNTGGAGSAAPKRRRRTFQESDDDDTAGAGSSAPRRPEPACDIVDLTADDDGQAEATEQARQAAAAAEQARQAEAAERSRLAANAAAQRARQAAAEAAAEQVRQAAAAEHARQAAAAAEQVRQAAAAAEQARQAAAAAEQARQVAVAEQARQAAEVAAAQAARQAAEEASSVAEEARRVAEAATQKALAELAAERAGRLAAEHGLRLEQNARVDAERAAQFRARQQAGAEAAGGAAAPDPRPDAEAAGGAAAPLAPAEEARELARLRSYNSPPRAEAAAARMARENYLWSSRYNARRGRKHNQDPEAWYGHD
jgi:hypothetical protein